MNFFSDEQSFFKQNIDIAKILLLDRTSKKNIVWATGDYSKHKIKINDHIKIKNIISDNFIKPRISKNKLEKFQRSKYMAEVFTPSWICNKQNNSIDNQFLGFENAFNVEKHQTWKTTTKKIDFSKSQINWKDYIKKTILEITCGEAPYLVSRYDSVSGEKIELNNRIGLLDRKFRIINENAQTNEEWIEQSFIALQSTYGYEYQGDNLFIARQNVFFTFIENFWNKFNQIPNNIFLTKAAEIISWNLWQMDGLSCIIPFICMEEKNKQDKLFVDEKNIEIKICEWCKKETSEKHNKIFSKIMNWEKNISEIFKK